MKLLRMLTQVLEPGQKVGALVLLCLMLVGMLVETLGVGLVLPALALMVSTDLLESYPQVQPLLDMLGNPSREMLAIIGVGTLAAAFTLKAIFLTYLSWVQAGFIFQLHASLSGRLFASYLRQPYPFHLRRNSAELIRNVINEVNLFTNAIQAILLIVSECFVIVGIVGLLIFVEPLGALVVSSTLGVVAVGFYLMLKARVLVWGTKRQFHDGKRIQHVQQGLGGVKDVKLLGREESFLASYRSHNLANAAMLQRQYFLQLVPRVLLETFAVCGLAGLVTAMVLQGREVAQILPVLGVFGIAAFRLLPSVNRVMTSLGATRFALPVITTLSAELALARVDPPAAVSGPFSFNDAIEVRNVSVQYEGMDSSAVDGVSLTIPRGASVGFVGDSGGGKSTLIDVLLGLIAPSQGQVLVDGVDIQGRLRRWQDHIGYVPQAIFLTDDSIRRNIAFGIAEEDIDEAAVSRALAGARLTEFVQSLPAGIETLVGERGVRLSGGQRQRIGIARALYHDPEVLVLDEATSSLDNETETRIMETIDAVRGKKTIIMVAHRLSTVANCDFLFEMKQGRATVTRNAAATQQ